MPICHHLLPMILHNVDFNLYTVKRRLSKFRIHRVFIESCIETIYALKRTVALHFSIT